MPETSKNPNGAENKGSAFNAAILKRKSGATIKQLLQLSDSCTSQALTSFDEPDITVRLELVEGLSITFDKLQSSLEDVDPDQIDSSTRMEFITAFLETKSKLVRELSYRKSSEMPRTSTARQFTLDDSQPSALLAHSKTRLPAVQIPKFTGAYSEWQEFYSVFETIVGKDANLTKIEKFQHLRSCLKDSVLDAIRSLELTDENYDQAIVILKERYENKRLNFQAHVRDIFDLQKVDQVAVLKLRVLSDGVNSHLRALATMGSKEQIADCVLIHLICSKLDYESRAKWEECTPVTEIPTWSMMSTFLEKRCQLLESMEYAMVNKTPSKQVGKNSLSLIKKRNVFVASSNSNSNCIFCNSPEHMIQNCQLFLNLSPNLRYKEVRKLHLCLNCLKMGHSAKTCKSKACQYCERKHNTLLHMNLPISGSSALITQTSDFPVATDITSCVQSTLPLPQISLVSSTSNNEQLKPNSLPANFVFIATAVVLIKNKVGSYLPCRAILDSASQLHFITNRITSQLQLNKSKIATLISGIGQTDFKADQMVNLYMKSRDQSYTNSFSAVVVPSIADCQPSCTLKNVEWNIPSNLNLADPYFFKTERIDILLGAGLFYELMCVGQIRLGDGLPLLQKTRLGWIVCGGGQTFIEKSCCLSAIKGTPQIEEVDIELNELVKQFWEIEHISDSLPKLSKAEQECEEHFVKNFTRLITGDYAVRLPLAMDTSNLGDSYQLAFRRFLNLEKRLVRNPELYRQYTAFMKEYLDLKHMSMVTDVPTGVQSYFLPHHCVIKNDSTTTKLRVVFDGSAKTTSGFSLNDVLLRGPTIQQNLFEILLRFRSFKIALTGDICKMYRCVRMTSPDNFLQCILWRDNIKDPIKIFKLDTVTYGTKPASFLAIRSMHQLALDEAEVYPVGSRIVCRDFYVDDMISGGNSVSEVEEIRTQTTNLLKKGNFVIRKWCSNESQILNDVAEFDRETLLEFHDGTNVTKALGLVWDPYKDNFLFSFLKPFVHKKTTKRGVLSTIARFYDPMGLIGPVITKSKIFMQLLWKEKLDWDESLPQSLHSIWNDFCAEFDNFNGLSFTRHVLTSRSELQVHAFCDASLSAYGACIYIRAKRGNKVIINLLCSKSRVSPLKTLTVPKLELCAADLLSKLITVVKKSQLFPAVFHCWSDSSVVLSWLQEEPSNYNVFVSNRVSSIQTLTQGMKWHYVPTKLNPADILSKGATPRELKDSMLWKHGPDFLKNSSNEWPHFPGLIHDLPERRKQVLISFSKPLDLSIECKFVNSFAKIQRVYAYVQKFINLRRYQPQELPQGNTRPNHLTVKDIQLGTFLLIRIVQMASLTTEYNSLINKKPIAASSKIHSLNPFLDNYGLIRVGGRLQNSLLDFESKHPIILPKRHPLTDSIITFFHKKLLHAGPQSLLASIRLQYWPIGGRKTVSSVLNKCIKCFRAKPRVIEHIMGSLPIERVQANRAFLVTGIDFCGPFFHQSEIRTRPPLKCYICLFICFATKAVHLELVKDLSTDSFLAALKRFVSIRGKPKTIWSDNATNFVGAKNELAELKDLFLTQAHQQAVQQHCLDDSIDWKFIPPRSPHFGGLWEASIKTAKYHFWRTAGLANLTFEELRTLVCQISAIINSRPLFPLSENPNDLEVLTPAHFLVGASLTSFVEPDVSSLNINRLSRWQRINFIQQVFWKKWSSEYLTLLQQRTKWRQHGSGLCDGDLVLLKDENLPPLKWPLARVIETIKRKDGVSRVAVLRTSNGTTRRAVNKLCILPITNEETLKAGTFQRGEDVQFDVNQP